LYATIRAAPINPKSTVPQIGAADAQWRANLDLSFARRGDRTLLAARSHQGPLQIQKALYPDGPGICHVTVLHPPGGVAGGDALAVAARLDAGSRVCLTTCGATKWYRCPRAEAQQQLHFSVEEGGALEWLPRESILFDGSKAAMQLDVELAAGAQFLGWEILCFGRRASGEGWHRGGLRLRTRIRQAGHPLWCERANLEAGSGFDSSPVGLGGYSVTGILVAAGADIGAELLGACRAVVPRARDSRVGVTRIPKVLLARYLGHSSQDAFHWFTSIWTLLRPALLNQPAIAPRLWAC
jgi:urease accessory protein